MFTLIDVPMCLGHLNLLFSSCVGWRQRLLIMSMMCGVFTLRFILPFMCLCYVMTDQMLEIPLRIKALLRKKAPCARENREKHATPTMITTMIPLQEIKEKA